MQYETIRVNARLPYDLNEWLEEEVARTGLSKSAIVMMATENYRREKEVFRSMADMGELVAKIEAMDMSIRSLTNENK